MIRNGGWISGGPLFEKLTPAGMRICSYPALLVVIRRHSGSCAISTGTGTASNTVSSSFDLARSRASLFPQGFVSPLAFRDIGHHARYAINSRRAFHWQIRDGQVSFTFVGIATLEFIVHGFAAETLIHFFFDDWLQIPQDSLPQPPDVLPLVLSSIPDS